MRLRRFSIIAGWAAVVLLAVVGFAAFGTAGEPALNDEIANGDAAMGHTAGAFAGATFAIATEPQGDPASEIADRTTDVVAILKTATPAGEDTTATTRPSTEVDASGWLSQIQVRALAEQYFTRADVNQAVRIAWCESRFDPASVNLRTGAVGLFQHLPQYWANRAAAAGFSGADPTDPEASTAAAAWEVYHGGGWDVFSCHG